MFVFGSGVLIGTPAGGSPINFGLAPSSGVTQTQFGETTTVPASSPYTYMTTNHSTFVADQGVIYASSSLPLKAVASSPAAGQYSLTAGVYMFSSADAGAAVLISYTYTMASSGESIAVSSQLIGPSISFSANLFASDPSTGKQFSVLLYNCVAEKLSFGTKLEDFLIPELDFQCFANAAGQVCQLNFGDAA